MAAIFTMTKKNSLDDHHSMNGQGKGGAHNNGIFSIIKKMKFTLKCVKLKNMILNKIIQAQNDRYHIISKTQVLASNFYTCIYVGVYIEPRKLERDP